jgi:hypothetical protein
MKVEYFNLTCASVTHNQTKLCPQSKSSTPVHTVLLLNNISKMFQAFLFQDRGLDLASSEPRLVNTQIFIFQL